MLSILRKNARSIFIYVVFGLIIVVFVFYFGWGDIRKRQEGWMIKVNRRTIFYNDYLKYYNQLINYYQNIYKRDFDKNMIEQLGIKQQATDYLINNLILLETAEKIRLTIPEMELKKAIEETPVFQNNGKFDADRYKQLLKQNRITTQEYENEQQQGLIISRIRNLVQDGVKFSERELWDRFVWENEKINLEFIEIHPEASLSTEEVGEEEIKKFYNEHKEEFRLPEKIKVKYLEFSPKNFEKEIKASPEEIDEYYKDFSEEFWEPKKVRARHILIKSDPNAPKNEKENAKKKAEEILSLIKNGKPFEEMAKKFSQDQATANQGGDLGFFPHGQMVKPVDDVVFGLKPGEVSEVVETKFGFHIIKVEEIKEEGTRPLEEVRDAIRKKLVEEKTGELTKKEAHRAYRTVLKNKDLEGYANKNGLNLIETNYFSMNEAPPILGGSEDLIKEVFSLTPGEIVYPFSFGNSYYLVRLLEKKKSYTPGLDEARGKMELNLKKEKQKRAAKTKGEDLLKKLKAGVSLQEVAEQEKLTIKETGPFSRESGRIPNIGASSEMTIAAFGLWPENPYPKDIFVVNEKVYLIKLKDKETPRPEEFEAKKKDLEKRYLFEKDGKYLDDWLKNARLHTDITLNPKITP